MHSSVTDLDGEAWWEAELDEVSETSEVSAGASHQVNNGGHLLHHRERVLLTHPQRPLKPEEQPGGHQKLNETSHPSTKHLESTKNFKFLLPNLNLI